MGWVCHGHPGLVPWPVPAMPLHGVAPVPRRGVRAVVLMPGSAAELRVQARYALPAGAPLLYFGSTVLRGEGFLRG